MPSFLPLGCVVVFGGLTVCRPHHQVIIVSLSVVEVILDWLAQTMAPWCVGRDGEGDFVGFVLRFFFVAFSFLCFKWTGDVVREGF